MAYRKNVRNSIPVRPVNRSAGKPSTKRYKSLEYEFMHKVIGEVRSLGPETKDKIKSQIGTICTFLDKRLNLNSVRSFKETHLRELVLHLQNDAISTKTGARLDVSTIYDTVTTARWMLKVLGKEPPSYADLGVFKRRADTQQPVDFAVVPDYEQNRQRLNDYLSQRNEWLGVADRLGMAFGLRAMERLGTRGDIVWREQGKMFLANTRGKVKEITERGLVARYGDASYGQNSRFIKDGRRYLVIEWSKGSLGRYSEIYTDVRDKALNEFRSYLRAHPTESRRIIPDTFSKKSAVKYYDNETGRARKTLDLTDYAYTANGDRHRDVQRQVAECRSDYQIIQDKGHYDRDKLDYYRRR